MTDNLKGILSVLGGATTFVLGDAFVKLASAELPSGEIIVLRGILATAFLVAGVLALNAARPLSLLFAPMMLLRFATAAGATICIVISLRDVPLAIVNTVLQVTPLAVTAGAALVYRERVGLSRWAAAVAGFAGVVLIVKPGTGDLGLSAFLVLLALAFATVRDLTTRGLERDIPSIFVAAGSSAAIVLTGFMIAPFEAAWTLPTARGWWLITAAAVCFFVANTLIIVGLRTGEIGVIAPFRYVAAPVSVLLGYWWWGDIPDALAFLGIGMVIAAGLYTLHRERVSLGARPMPVPGRSAAE
jgi:drug/metabolite transporter (DMT)-like permease